MRIAIATCSVVLEELTGDELLAEALRRRGAAASFEIWDDPLVRWHEFDLVVIRSTWDYTRKLDRFHRWLRELRAPLLNAPEMVLWNSEKTYLADLAAAGVSTIRTTYVRPGEPAPELAGEVVVKPTVSAGARDTGRFSASRHDDARELIAAIGSSGRVAMVQPYLARVDERGETALVLIDGEESHALRKRAVLRPDEVAPLRDDPLGAAEAMYDDGLVRADTATATERDLARSVIAALAQRFGAVPLFARVDMVEDDAGDPTVIELEAIEPSLYLHEAPAAAERLAAAIVARIASTAARR